MKPIIKIIPPPHTAATLKLAKKYGLIATGGTDYHGIGDSHEVMMGGVEVPMAAAERLISLAKKLSLKNKNII